MENNKVSIVICHFTGDLIDRCLKSLEQIKTEKIVVTSSYLFHHHPSTTLTLIYPNNPALKRNKGVFFSAGEYIVFLDDDVEVEEDCIIQMAYYLDRNSDVGMVYATLYKMDNHDKLDTSGSFFTWCGFLNETYERRTEAIPILSGKSACCMVRKDIFDEVGGFDEDFVIYGEETDLSWRIWLAGYKVMVLPWAIAYHAFETSLKPRSYYNQYFIHYHGCKNYLTMLIKNLPARKLYIVGINAFLWFIMGCALWLRNRQGGRWIFKGLLYNIRNFGYLWSKRSKVKRYSNNFPKNKNPSLFYYFERFKDYLIHRLHG